MKTETIERIPDWAACYLMYGDEPGLSMEDKALADEFVGRLKEDGLTLVCPIEGSERFTWRPAFGLAADVSDWTAYAKEGGEE